MQKLKNLFIAFAGMTALIALISLLREELFINLPEEITGCVGRDVGEMLQQVISESFLSLDHV